MMSQHDPPTSEYGGRDGVGVSFNRSLPVCIVSWCHNMTHPPQHVETAMGVVCHLIYPCLYVLSHGVTT